MRTERVPLFMTLYIFSCCTVLLGEGFEIRKKEAVHDQQIKTENLAVHNVELNGSSTLGTVSSHKSEIKEEDHIGIGVEAFCNLCVGEHPFDRRCRTLCRKYSSSNKTPLENVNSQETATSSHATATKKDYDNQDLQHNDSRSDSQTINKHEESKENKFSQNLHSKTDGKIVEAENQVGTQSQRGSEHSKSEEPTKLGSDDIGVISPDHVTISTDDSSSRLSSIVFVFSSAALIIIVLLISIKLWMRKKSRESYRTMRESRPSSLIEVLNDHSD